MTVRNGILEFVGGAFLLTAITYASGRGYFNGYFRSVRVDPAFVDVAVDQIFFEGGREIIKVVSPVAYPLLFFVVASVLLALLGTLYLKKIASARAENLLLACSQLKGIFLLVGIVWFSNYLFNSAMKSGGEVAATNGCNFVVVHVNDKDSQTGCLIYKSVDNIWVRYETEGSEYVSVFPRDNFSRADMKMRN
ncbi:MULTISPECIES: hypothetical protein [Pseudomonas]|uniref:Uncharacterized protein n=1 Tax=Pseudomonas monteilii TaxID=76759 RepID=A0A7W2QQQ3_9PSED|nr:MULTISPECIES: hypothetical protein [Pseudomonas]MBA6139379.1 hypothetical protein [Pseudomonas monteilii]MDT3747959.1 hypothetical protein [Pseudomonas kurunegalensis]MVF51528.1 hypothetical protein [Pseudomonas monteilii]